LFDVWLLDQVKCNRVTNVHDVETSLLVAVYWAENLFQVAIGVTTVSFAF